MAAPTVHASCVAIGDTGVLIRGPSGAGKSMLALQLVLDAPRCLPLGQLVADDRVLVEGEGEILWAQAPAALAGLIEVRGLGIRRLPHRARVALGLVVDLAARDALRMPLDRAQTILICDRPLPRIAPECLESAALLIAAVLRGEPYAN